MCQEEPVGLEREELVEKVVIKDIQIPGHSSGRVKGKRGLEGVRKELRFKIG